MANMAQFKITIITLGLLLSLASAWANVVGTIRSLRPTEHCDTSVVELGTLAVVELKGTPIVNGTFQLLTDLDDVHYVNISLSKVSGPNQAAPVVVSSRAGHLCTLVATQSNWLLPDVDVGPPVTACPVPAGEYYVKQFQFFRYFWGYTERGEHEFQVALMRNGDLVCGVVLSVVVEDGKTPANSGIVERVPYAAV